MLDLFLTLTYVLHFFFLGTVYLLSSQSIKVILDRKSNCRCHKMLQNRCIVDFIFTLDAGVTKSLAIDQILSEINIIRFSEDNILIFLWDGLIF